MSTSFHASVLLWIMNFIITFQSSCGSADYFDSVMTRFMVNNRTDV